MTLYPDYDYPTARPAPRRPSALGRGLPILLLIFGVLAGFALYRVWIDRGRPSAQPRAVTARGDLAADEKATIELFNANKSSVVFITTLRQGLDLSRRSVLDIPVGTGSGFIWDDAGHIVTNFHVVQNGSGGAKVRMWDHETYDAEVVGVAPNYDLALLRVNAPASKLRPIPVGESGNLQVGQKTFAISNPFGLDQTLTTGVLSALGRTIQAVTGRPIEDVLQTDAAVNPGNSGGPLLDSAGRLIGVNTAIYSPSGASAGIGFAVPVDTVNRIIPQLIAQGKVVRPFMGVRISDPIGQQITQRMGVPGLLVMVVEAGSPAERAGIQGTRTTPDGSRIIPGDVIQAVNGKAVKNSDELYAALERRKPGDEVTLTLYRNKQTREVKVKLEAPRENG
jgi:S1-C subfamily serine protease